jgi:hypothetical protein
MRLYRVLREQVYDGGWGRREVQNVEVLYSGYDRTEAARVYFANPPGRYSGPGSYYARVRCLSRLIAEDSPAR